MISANRRSIYANILGASFVERPVKTGWGKWSLVEGTLLALDLLYQQADPDWFFLLSASDYPIASPEKVRRDLAATEADALMDYRRVPKTGLPEPIDGAAECLSHHGNDGNIHLARIRYLRSILKIPILRSNEGDENAKSGRKWRVGSFTASFGLQSPLSPFRNNFECYVGSQWFTARRRVARQLLSASPDSQKLARYLRWRVVPDETFFQTQLCNDARFRIDPDPRRFADWGRGGAHPKKMTAERVERATIEGAHFARKFEQDSPLLDKLDQRLAVAAQGSRTR